MALPICSVLRYGATSIHGVDVRREYEKLPHVHESSWVCAVYQRLQAFRPSSLGTRYRKGALNIYGIMS